MFTFVPMAKEMAEKSNRGGRREGAGRKRSAGRSVTFRVALDVEDHLEDNLPASDFLNSLIREHKHLSSMKLPFDVYSFTGSDPVMIPYSLHGLVAGFPIPLDNDEKSQSLDLIRLLGLNKESVFIVRVNKNDGVECLEILQNLFPDGKTQMVVAMDEETILLVMDLSENVDSFLNETSKTILDNLNAETMIRAHVGIGMPAPTLRDIAKSYREATLALRVGSIFESEQFIMRYDKLGLGRLIYQLPPTLCNMFLSEVFPKGAYESLDSDTLVTIQSFFENNLNGSETSRKLFVHRNTLVYRLDKVQKITGLDLRSFDDAVLFKLAAMVRTYLEKQEKLRYNFHLKIYNLNRKLRRS